MPKITPVTIDSVAASLGWAPDQPELLWLKKLDGAGAGQKKDGLISASEIRAGILRPKANELQPFISTEVLVAARKLLGTPQEKKQLPVALRSWLESADGNNDKLLSMDELSALVETNTNAVISYQRLGVLAAQIAALSGEKTDLGWIVTNENRRYYRVDHDGVKRVPRQVGYNLSAADLAARRELLRVDRFRGDSELPKGSTSIPAWFDNSGFDMGHMMPVEDYGNKEAQDLSFLMSNVAPQYPKLNQFVWKSLEDGIRDLVKATGGVAQISTGTLFVDDKGAPLSDDAVQWIGPDKDKKDGARRVAVPTHLYKAVQLTTQDGKKYSFAYLVPNEAAVPTKKEGIRGYLQDRRVSVASLERRLGQKLFTDVNQAHKRDTQGLHVLLRKLQADGLIDAQRLALIDYNNIATLWPTDLALPA